MHRASDRASHQASDRAVPGVAVRTVPPPRTPAASDAYIRTGTLSPVRPVTGPGALRWYRCPCQPGAGPEGKNHAWLRRGVWRTAGTSWDLAPARVTGRQGTAARSPQGGRFRGRPEPAASGRIQPRSGASGRSEGAGVRPPARHEPAPSRAPSGTAPRHSAAQPPAAGARPGPPHRPWFRAHSPAPVPSRQELPAPPNPPSAPQTHPAAMCWASHKFCVSSRATNCSGHRSCMRNQWPHPYPHSREGPQTPCRVTRHAGLR